MKTKNLKKTKHGCFPHDLAGPKTKPRLGDLPAPGMATGTKLLIGAGIGLGIWYFKDKIEAAIFPQKPALGRGEWVPFNHNGLSVEARIDGAEKDPDGKVWLTAAFRNEGKETIGLVGLDVFIGFSEAYKDGGWEKHKIIDGAEMTRIPPGGKIAVFKAKAALPPRLANGDGKHHIVLFGTDTYAATSRFSARTELTFNHNP